MGLDNVGKHFKDMRRRPDLFNLVLFWGADLIVNIKEYEMPLGTTPEPNPYFGKSKDDLDEILSESGKESDSYHQLQRRRFSWPKLEIPH